MDRATPSQATGNQLPELTAPSLPKGGGAIAGLGETFEAGGFTGTGSLSIPIGTSRSRGGSGPQLSLSYNSGSGNGPFGLGFRLSPPAITRKTERGLPRYLDDEDSDVFLLDGAEDLVPALEPEGPLWTPIVREEGAFRVTRYRPRIEAAFARIERWEDQRDGTSHFRVTDSSNVTSFFGRTQASRVTAPGSAGRIFSWLLDRVEDDRGNITVYAYKPEDLEGVDVQAPWEAGRGEARPQRYLRRIRYGNRRPLAADDGDDGDWMFEVVFDYGEYGDPPPAPDVEVAEDITISAAATAAWTARPDPFSTHRPGFDLRTHRLCRRMLMFHRFTELGDEPLLVASTDLDYELSPFGCRLHTVTRRGYTVQPDGRLRAQAMPPLTLEYSPHEPRPTAHSVDTDSLADLGGGVDAARLRLVDLDGDGIPGILLFHDGHWAYKPPRGEGRFGALRGLARTPVLARGGTPTLTDLDGNGLLSLVTDDGSYEREPSGWGPFRAMSTIPTGVDAGGSRTRRVDLTGDGLADLLVDQGDYFEWYNSAGRDGFGAPVRVAKPTDADHGPTMVYGTESVLIATADMSGDGLSDIVRVNATGAVYWPNLGYGRFGGAIVLGGDGPFDRPERFRADRVSLADADGTGPTDIVYFGEDGAALWRNASGNRLVGPTSIPGVPPVHDLVHADVLDLEGSGGACVVWSSPLPGDAGRQVRYVRLHETVPNLLVATRNGLGLETRVAYAPSTRFAMADRAAGRPWRTQLPFPVQVIERVEVLDHVTGQRTVATHAYHHGYFDGPEREFRGFAMVERRDSEAFAHFAEPGLFDTGHRIDDGLLHVPPALTRTWYHVGAYHGYETLARGLADEYWSGDPQAVALQLPDTNLPAGLTPAEAREAVRALKGSVLREELYAEDGSDRAHIPYTVAERNLALRLIQPRAGQRHAVFLAHEHESLQLDYERDADDPRVAHTIVLAVDEFGTVHSSAQIAYPRRRPAFPEQAQAAIVVTEVDVTHQPFQPDRHRLASPVQTEVFEVTGVPVSAAPFTRVSAAELAAGARRLLSRSRVRYYRDDLGGPLPLAQVGLRALVFEEQTAAFTAQQIAEVFPTVDAAVLADEGGYLMDEGLWWTRSARRVHDPQRFFTVTEIHDPFGNVTRLDYDADVLFVTGLTDPVLNRVEALFDRRVLAPRRVTDPNGNIVEGTFDGLGRVTAAAAIGKPGLAEADTLDDPTSRFSYDAWAYHRTQRPAWSRTERRETHRDPGTRWLPEVTYSDGRGQVVQTKVRAAPGPVPHLGEQIVEQRWIGTGRTVRNNKGQPIKQYEPYFSATDAYEDEAALVEQGATPLLHYDPLGRLLRTDLPDGTLTRAEWSAWHSRDFDAGDTVRDSRWHAERIALPPTDPQRRAAALSEAYHDTPTVTHLDSLGRATRVVADLGAGVTAQTRSVLDIQGNLLEVIDARGNIAETSIYGMAEQSLQTESPDAGQRRALSDVAGGGLRAFDDPATDRIHRFEYDARRRLTHHWVGEALITRNVYGEQATDAAAANLRGQRLRQYDAAGMLANHGFDLDGNLLRQHRQVAVAFDATPDWRALAATSATLSTLDTAATGLLESELFTTEASFDALGRPAARTTPDGSVTRHTYNAAGLLESIVLDAASAEGSTSVIVAGIDYDVHGRRAMVRYGNGVTTIYDYDPVSFRLTRIRTSRAIGAGPLQDLAYTYDAVGNIVEIRDAAQQRVFFANQVVEPHQQFTYDAWYRLVEATGREHIGLTQPTHAQPVAQPHPNDAAALRRYTERYTYDLVGNILTHQHAGHWTREYAYATDSNRLLANSAPGDMPGALLGHHYTYDAHGNMAAMPHLPTINWDHADRMRHADRGGGGNAFFMYDSAGDRVRKTWVNLPGALRRERIYVGDFELFRERGADGTVRLERQTLQLTNGSQRIAQIDTRTQGTDEAPARSLLFQLANHLGSATLEVDQHANVVSYEEYHPFGSTSYAANSAVEVSSKRYRYLGKERDEETGLHYCGARYYATWLGRWSAPDPEGLVDGPARYSYARNNPVSLHDRSGSLAQPATTDEEGPAYEGDIHHSEGELRRDIEKRKDKQPTEQDEAQQAEFRKARRKMVRIEWTQIPATGTIVITFPDKSYAQPEVAQAMQWVAEKFETGYRGRDRHGNEVDVPPHPGYKVVIRDVSKKGGGPLPKDRTGKRFHKQHHRGLSVDIQWVWKDKAENNRLRNKHPSYKGHPGYSREYTQHLIILLHANPHAAIDVIWFDDLAVDTGMKQRGGKSDRIHSSHMHAEYLDARAPEKIGGRLHRQPIGSQVQPATGPTPPPPDVDPREYRGPTAVTPSGVADIYWGKYIYVGHLPVPLR